MIKVKYAASGLIVLLACKKGPKITSNNVAINTTGTIIIPQKDPAIAKSAGFFLDDAESKQ